MSLTIEFTNQMPASKKGLVINVDKIRRLGGCGFRVLIGLAIGLEGTPYILPPFMVAQPKQQWAETCAARAMKAAALLDNVDGLTRHSRAIFGTLQCLNGNAINLSQAEPPKQSANP